MLTPYTNLDFLLDAMIILVVNNKGVRDMWKLWLRALRTDFVSNIWHLFILLRPNVSALQKQKSAEEGENFNNLTETDLLKFHIKAKSLSE